MKRFLLAFVLVSLLLVLPTQVSASVAIWQEGFENGLPANMSRVLSGSRWIMVKSYSDTPHSGLFYLDNEGPTLAEDAVVFDLDSRGYENLTLECYLRVKEGLEGSDVFGVRWSPDGINWRELKTYINEAAGAWFRESFTLPSEANDNPTLRVLFAFLAGSGGDRVNIDDCGIWGDIITPEPTTFVLSVLGIMALRRRPL